MPDESKLLIAYIDLRSPYSFVAIKPIRNLSHELGVTLDWRPFGIDVEASYGAADARDDRALRKVKYIYRDARRLAEPQGLTIRGPERIYDPTLAHIAMLYAKDAGFLDQFVDTVYARFFDRAIDVGNPDELAGLVAELGGSKTDYEKFARGNGPGELAAVTAEAERLGVFGVPTLVFDGELYWGGDRLDMIRASCRKKPERE